MCVFTHLCMCVCVWGECRTIGTTSAPPTKSLPKRNALQREGNANDRVQAELGRWDLPVCLPFQGSGRQTGFKSQL